MNKGATDDIEEESLTETKDVSLTDLLNRHGKKLGLKCSNRDLLFQEADAEELTDEEKADADNSFNNIMSTQNSRSYKVDDEKVEVISMDSIVIRERSVTPLPPFFIKENGKMVGWVFRQVINITDGTSGIMDYELVFQDSHKKEVFIGKANVESMYEHTFCEQGYLCVEFPLKMCKYTKAKYRIKTRCGWSEFSPYSAICYA